LADRLALLYPFATKAKNPFNIKALADHCATQAGLSRALPAERFEIRAPSSVLSPGIDRGFAAAFTTLGAARPATRKTQSMSVTIKVALEITVSDTALEDAMAEYDELSVEGLVKEILDKAIACDNVIARVDEGPNTLEEYDQLTS
jgi:hypothetical protein